MPDARTTFAREAIERTLARHERRLLEAFPRIDLLLDAARVREAIERRLAGITRLETPVPHVVVPDVFDDEVYALLESAWPPYEVFREDARRQKLDLVPTLAADTDARAAGYDLLPPEVRRVWDFFVFVINRQILSPWLAELFAPEIDVRLDQLRRAHAAGLITYQMSGARDWSFRSNVGRFMVRSNGYVLKPHVDSAPYLVTALLYFPAPGQDEGCGTVFFRPKEPLDLETVLRSGSTQFFDKAGIDCEEALRVPYRRNTLLAFPNTLTAAHGVSAPKDGHRRVFQFHLSLKGDHEKV